MQSASVFELPTEKDQEFQNKVDEFLGDICNLTGKSFASIPNHMLADTLNKYIQDIESSIVKVQSKSSTLKKLKQCVAVVEASGFATDTDVLPLTEKLSKGWHFSSNRCVSVMMSIHDGLAILNVAKLPSGAVRYQNCEAAALQAMQCVFQINLMFQQVASKFSMEKGLGTGGKFSGQIEVLKDLGKDGTQALKQLVAGEGDEDAADLMGEMRQESQDRQEIWLRERGNTALIQCINDCQCLHELLLRHVGNVAIELLPAQVAAVLGNVSPGDYASTSTYSRELNSLLFQAYEQCAYPLPEELGLNALQGLHPSMTAMSHFRRPLLQIESIWRDMCKILANRIGLGLEDTLSRFLKKMVYVLQPEIQDRKDQYEDHCKQFYTLVDDCMDAGADIGGVSGDSKHRRDRQALLLNIRDDLMHTFYAKALLGVIDNMRHVVEICLVQDLYALITQILSTMLRDRCRYCVSTHQFSGLSKYFRAILQAFEDLFLGRRADKIFSALSQSWVDQHTAFLKEEISMMAVESTQLIRIANAPIDSMDNKTSFGTSRSHIASGILIARKSDKKALQYSIDTSSKAAKSVDQIEAALLGRMERKSSQTNEHGFIAQSSLKTFKKGWMVKEGQMQKSWKKRWFVLQGQELSYFDDQSEQKQKGFVRLTSDCQVLPMQRPKKAGFSILSQVISSF